MANRKTNKLLNAPAFVAIPVPEFINWPDQVGGLPGHITLAFIGWVSDEERVALNAVVAEVATATKTFKVECAGLGHFHNGGRTTAFLNVLTAEVLALNDRLMAALDAAGIKVPKGPAFVPHLTIGYLPAGCEWDGNDDPVEWVVRKITVYGGPLPEHHGVGE